MNGKIVVSYDLPNVGIYIHGTLFHGYVDRFIKKVWNEVFGFSLIPIKVGKIRLKNIYLLNSEHLSLLKDLDSVFDQTFVYTSVLEKHFTVFRSDILLEEYKKILKESKNGIYYRDILLFYFDGEPHLKVYTVKIKFPDPEEFKQWLEELKQFRRVDIPLRY